MLVARKASLNSVSWLLMPSRAEASRALLAMRLECLSLRTLSALGLGRSEGARRPFLDGGRWASAAGGEGQHMRSQPEDWARMHTPSLACFEWIRELWMYAKLWALAG